MPNTVTQAEKEEMELTTYGPLVLNLSDNVLWQVIDQETTFIMWTKLEELYMSLRIYQTRYYLWERFFTFKMDLSNSLTDNLDDYKKIVSNLKIRLTKKLQMHWSTGENQSQLMTLFQT